MSRQLNTQDDVLSGNGLSFQDASLLDFWKWAFSDLCDDDIKGIFAEWMVMKLLRINSERRCSWANSDIVTSDGVRIEVKASSYWQSWRDIDGMGKQRAQPLLPKKDWGVRFAGLKARSAEGNPDASEVKSAKSMIYVFALQNHGGPLHVNSQMPEDWNAMNLSQWEFYILSAKEIKYGSVSLASLKAGNNGPLKASEFAARMDKEINALKGAM